jgi:hypothetical protein
MHRRTDYPAHQTATGATQTKTMKKSKGRESHSVSKPAKQGKLSQPKPQPTKEKKGEVEDYGN